MQRQYSTTWSIADPITAARLNNFNQDLDDIFKRLSNEDLDISYNADGTIASIVDNENTVTINFDWQLWLDPQVLYIQEVGATTKHKVTFNANGYVSNITVVPV